MGLRPVGARAGQSPCLLNARAVTVLLSQQVYMSLLVEGLRSERAERFPVFAPSNVLGVSAGPLKRGLRSPLQEESRYAVLGRNFHCGVEVHLSRRSAGTHSAMTRPRRSRAVLAHSPQVNLDGPSDPAQHHVDGPSRGDATRQIRYRCTPIAIPVLVDTDEILHLSHTLSRTLTTSD